MREKLIAILDDIDEDIASFDGDNLFDAGLIDSFVLLGIVSEMEETFHVQIKADDVIEKNFRTVDSMLALLEGLVGKE